MRDPRQVQAPRIDPSADSTQQPPFDALKLCVFATVALLGFAVLAVVGYARARRHGLLRSKCKLGDTRLVLLYLVVLAAAAAFGIYLLLV